jgi:D-alanine--poly(phosphoribitol) ligase subunit 1
MKTSFRQGLLDALNRFGPRKAAPELSYDQLLLQIQTDKLLIDTHWNETDLVPVIASRSTRLIPFVLAIWMSGRGVLALRSALSPECMAKLPVAPGIPWALLGPESWSRQLKSMAPEVSIVEPPPLMRAPAAPEFFDRGLELGARSKTAFAIQTSGTTGDPKLIRVGFEQFDALWKATNHSLAPAPGLTWLQGFEWGFDGYFADLLWALGSGMEIRTLDWLLFRAKPELLSTIQPAVISGPPGLFAALARSLPAGSLPELRQALFAGEPLFRSQADLWRKVAPRARIENLYGPAEATVLAMKFILNPGEPLPDSATVPIGQPIPGVSVKTDEDGELLLSGPQIVEGVGVEASPEDPHTLWYRTGDLVTRWHDQWVYCGRKDHLLKIDGVKFQPEEIEELLEFDAPGAIAVAVVDARDSTPEICLVLTSEITPDIDALLEKLSRKVTARFVPRRVFRIDRLPLTATGKTDRVLITRLIRDHNLERIH